MSSEPRPFPSATPTANDPLSESRRLVERIVRVTDMPATSVIEHLKNEQRDLGSTVRAELARREIEPYAWSDQLSDFYRESDAMLFETVVWNRTPTKAQMRSWILDFLAQDDGKPKRILTFGDGLGFDSLALALAGHTVDYYEVAEKAICFAGDLFADAGVKVNMIGSPSDLDQHKYDAVVCLDVLEHVPAPCEVVDFLVAALRPGGHLVIHAPFFYLSPAVQTHLRSNRRYSGDLRKLYTRSGLRPVDAAVFWNPLILEKPVANAATAKRGWAALCRLWAGQLLLFPGRYWATPHTIISGWMASQGRMEWPELIALEQEYRSRGVSAAVAHP